MTFHNVISRQPMLLVVVVCCWLLAAPGSVVVEGFVHLPVLHSGCWDNRSRLLLAQRINENEKMNGILLDRMEEEVLASAKNQLDYNTLVKALSLRGVDQNGGDYNDSNNQKSSKLLAVLEEYGQQLPTSMWQVSFAAATVSSVLVFTLFFHNVYMAVFVFGVVFLVASQDPVNDESLLGAVARLLGRQTIQSYEASLPKLKALARAVVTGEEEILQLQHKLAYLEQENAQLQQWKQIRLTAESTLSNYTVDELKQTARGHNLLVGGTKLQLLIRLLETNVIDCHAKK